MGCKAIILGEDKWDPLLLLPSRWVVNIKQCRLLGEFEEIIATIQKLVKVGIIRPT